MLERCARARARVLRGRAPRWIHRLRRTSRGRHLPHHRLEAVEKLAVEVLERFSAHEKPSQPPRRLCWESLFVAAQRVQIFVGEVLQRVGVEDAHRVCTPRQRPLSVCARGSHHGRRTPGAHVVAVRPRRRRTMMPDGSGLIAARAHFAFACRRRLSLRRRPSAFAHNHSRVRSNDCGRVSRQTCSAV